MKLTNLDIYQAYPNLQRVGDLKIPIRASMEIAKLSNAMRPHFEAIEKERVKNVKHYGKENEDGSFNIDKAIPEQQELFWKDFEELMNQEVEISFKEIIKLPEKVSSTCDKCHHNMDKPLEIEPNTLLSLVKFVEVS